MKSIKKSIIAPTIIIFSIILMVCFYIIYFPSIQLVRNHGFQNDTIQIRYLLVKGDQLRGSNQDSCRMVYKQAIELAQSHIRSKETYHLIGLGYIGIAALNCNMGNYLESLEYQKNAIKTAEVYSDNDIKAQAINIRGLLYYNQSNYDSAVICYQGAMPLAKKAGNKKLEGKIYTNIAIINYLNGKWEQAIANFSQTLSIAEDLRDVDLITGTYLNMGLVASNFGEYDKAIGFYNKAIESYKKIEGKDGLILCYQNLGNLYLLLANYEKAIEAYNLSLQLSVEIGDKTNIAKAHHNKAELFAKVGDYEQAMEEYLISIRQKEELNDKSMLADGYNGLGNLHFQHNNYDKAVELYQKSLQIYEELDLPRGKSTTYSYIANIYSAKHQYSEALKYHLKALQLSKDVNNTSGIADQSISVGACYSKLQKFRIAEEYFLKALRMKTELSEKEGVSMVYLELANSKLIEAKYSDLQNREAIYEQAVDYGLNSLSIAEELKVIPTVNMASYSLTQAYRALEQEKEALKYADKYISSNDSLYSKTKAEAITYAEARWNVEKYQTIIQSLETNSKLQEELLLSKEKETKQQRIIIYFGFGILLLIVALAISSAINNRKRRDLLYQKQLNNLTILKMQNIKNRISPHFIFNMLSTISQSITDPEGAKNKIDNLSMLLRNVIENIEQTAITLADELSIVKKIVELQKEKITPPFIFDIFIDPAVNMEMHIPAMMIQIPVENAIKHGLMPKEQGSRELFISAKKADNGTMVTVTDNGIGLNNQQGRTAGTGSGLKMIMQTIQFLNSKNKYKIMFSISQRNNPTEGSFGTVAEIFIPDEFVFFDTINNDDYKI